MKGSALDFLNLGKFSVSLACVLMLEAGKLNANYVESYKAPKSTKTQTISEVKPNKNYVDLCNKIYESNTFLCLNFLQNQTFLEDTIQRQQVKKHIKLLQKVINVADERIKAGGIHAEYNQKVFYSSVAIKNILKEICDENFMRIVGAYQGDLENFDIIAYAKGVLKAENELRG